MARSTQAHKTLVTVPGKVILFGEHAVVYPVNHAILWPIRALSLTVEAQETGDTSGYTIALPDHDDITVQWSRLSQQVNSARSAYAEFKKNEDTKRLRSYKDIEVYLRLCCALAHEYVEKHMSARSLQLMLETNIPAGGFGLSAALAAATVKAIITAHNLELDNQTWFKLALEAEKLVHGSPSGADVAVITRGTPIVVTKQANDSIRIEPLVVTSKLQNVLKNTFVMHTGRPQQSTAEVVQHVSNQATSAVIIEQIEANTQLVLQAIKSNQMTFEQWCEYMNTSGRLLEQLGVVPEKFKKLSSMVRTHDHGAIKISGAGAISGVTCGVILATDNTTLKNEYDVYNLL